MSRMRRPPSDLHAQGNVDQGNVLANALVQSLPPEATGADRLFGLVIALVLEVRRQGWPDADILKALRACLGADLYRFRQGTPS